MKKQTESTQPELDPGLHCKEVMSYFGKSAFQLSPPETYLTLQHLDIYLVPSYSLTYQAFPADDSRLLR